MADETGAAADPGALFGDAGGSTDPQPAAGDGKAKDSLAKFNGEDGKRDYAKLEKSYLELESSHGRLVTEKQERDRAAQEGVPKAAADYGLDFDWDGLKERAGRVYTDGQMDHPDASEFFAAAHKHGVTKAHAQAVFADIMEARHARTDEAKSREQRRAEAVAAVTGGQNLWNDIRASLGEQAKVRDFASDERTALEEMAATPAGLRVLHRLLRGSASSAPPSVRSAPPVDLDREAKEILDLMGETDDSKFAANAAEIERRVKKHFPSGVVPGV